MLLRSPFFLAPPASWNHEVAMAKRGVDAHADAPSIAPATFQVQLQQYFNMCATDSQLFDFGRVYGEINRQKGIKGTALLALQPLIDRLLAISPCGKVRKPELVAAVVAILAANKHRTVLPNHQRHDVVRYIVAQASLHLVFILDHGPIARLSVKIKNKNNTFKQF